MNRQEFDASVSKTQVTTPAEYRNKGRSNGEYPLTSLFYVIHFERSAQPVEERRQSLYKAGRKLQLLREELPEGSSAIAAIDAAYRVLGNYAINYALDGNLNPSLLKLVKEKIVAASDAVSVVRDTVEG